jgi:hypothetical protein
MANRREWSIWQSLKDHLRGAADRAWNFAIPSGMGMLMEKILGVAVELSWMPTLRKDKPRLQKLGIELARMPHES